MRLGIFADIHGNISAFEKTWECLKKEKCELYIFLGDLCGYYYHQNEVIGILRGIKNLVSLRGNHDDIFLRMLKGNDILAKKYSLKYGRSNEILKDTIKATNLDFLNKLPKKHIISEYKLAAFHGSPWDYMSEYIYPDMPLERFRRLPYRFILLAHTHYPMNRTIFRTRVINPGSCGQPRDYNSASFALLDLNSGEVKFKRVSYNTGSLVKEILRNKENKSYLIEVLKRKPD